ncbi:copper chaperone PCu(A)C [Shewanella sp. Scap07]|uniref:copper chaperone PCu(A)C n=2 Tax=Shewanella TaxID=22 RepID=UPI0015BCEE3B|nr:copper chaperone PCu(A)C [Shewanella sp. Scap07]QLE87911.1 copper chaperone PCu(A)C [Shewanella sp. Scap07]
MFKFLLLSCLSFTASANVVLVDGFVRAMPASVPNTAAYFVLQNHGPNLELVSVDVDFAKEAQLHTVIEENGVVKMRQVNSFSVPMHGELRLDESGEHVMLMGLKHQLPVGQNVELVLHFNDGSQLPISLKVSKQDMAKEGGHHHHHHHH